MLEGVNQVIAYYYPPYGTYQTAEGRNR